MAETATPKKKTSANVKSSFAGNAQETAQKRLESIQGTRQGLSARLNEVGGKSLSSTERQHLSGLEAETRQLNSTLSSEENALTASQKDIISGAQFGESVIGEGLGRLGTDEDVKGTLDRMKGISEKGMSGAEFVAQREKAFQGISQSTQTASRSLMAQQARSGARGGTAGSQLGNVQVSGMQAKKKNDSIFSSLSNASSLISS